MHWLEVAVTVDGETAEAVSEALAPYAYQSSVVLEQLGDELNPEPLALESEITVKIYIPGDEDSPEIRTRIRKTLFYMGMMLAIPEPLFRELEDEDWATAWRTNFRPFRVGKRINVQPSWLDPEPPNSDDIVITIDPGMAFGTGLHPSTQMCLQVMEQLLAPGNRVLDVGCGSGILSIAAAKLGAARVIAFDNDRMAAITTADNAIENDVAGVIDVFQGLLSALYPQSSNLVVVNILAPVIISLIEGDDLLRYTGKDGHLILSGIIEEQLPSVSSTVLAAGGQITKTMITGDWVCLIARPSSE